jgi:hypothetical protein
MAGSSAGGPYRRLSARLPTDVGNSDQTEQVGRERLSFAG